MAFKKAERLLTNPTIAIMGPTGSGKTMSALKLASGIAKAMGKRFAVIDTENGSASLYSDSFDFDTLNITPPFTTEKYIQAINDAEKGGYCALVCDSITHAWAGEGGLLEQKAQLDSRPNTNHWTNWNPIKAKDLKFRNAYLHSSIPFFIATMRSKMEYMQSEDNGKKKVSKVGMAPVQSDGIEYEFSVVFDLAMNHEAEVSKDRTGIFSKTKIFQITEETGETLSAWRQSGKAKPLPPPPPKPENEKQQAPNYEEAEPDLDEVFGLKKESSPVQRREIAGQFVITWGPYKNKMINSFSAEELRVYCDDLQSTAAQQQREIDPNGLVGKLLENAAIWLGME